MFSRRAAAAAAAAAAKDRDAEEEETKQSTVNNNSSFRSQRQREEAEQNGGGAIQDHEKTHDDQQDDEQEFVEQDYCHPSLYVGRHDAMVSAEDEEKHNVKVDPDRQLDYSSDPPPAAAAAAPAAAPAAAAASGKNTRRREGRRLQSPPKYDALPLTTVEADVSSKKSLMPIVSNYRDYSVELREDLAKYMTISAPQLE